MERTVALAGNPNVGKSSLFNRLTGLRQHTGNWTGKTVETAAGRCGSYRLVDLPGTYSLRPGSAEERVTRDYLLRGEAKAVVVVCDACCLERNLSLARQCRALCPRMLVCVNMLDEARRRGLRVDCEALSRGLGLPVIGLSAREKGSRAALIAALDALFEAPPRPADPGKGAEEAEEPCAQRLFEESRRLCRLALRGEGGAYGPRDARLDRILTGRVWAFPVMLLLLLGICFLTIRGANLPSAWLSRGFAFLGGLLRRGFRALGAPAWLEGLLLDGAYGSLSLVTAVMLPPMAIFFPLFSLLEDAGFLPRAAYNLDRPFQACGACGKQGLCMLMGLGCNAVGVTGSRIIASRRERLLAILTNSITPCNGRFPLLIALLGMFFAPAGSSALLSAGLLSLVLCGSATLSLAATALLDRTLLRGESAGFVLELPPYRRPQIGRVLLRSLLDRTLKVLGRAAAVAAPAGALLWLLGRVQTESGSLLTVWAGALDGLGRFFGMDGAILLAFLLGLPANETVLPILLGIYGAAGGEMPEIRAVLLQNGWTSVTALCVLLFTLLHWPCSTTLLTIRRETGSWRWTALAALVPTVIGLVLCAMVRVLSFQI